MRAFWAKELSAAMSRLTDKECIELEPFYEVYCSQNDGLNIEAWVFDLTLILIGAAIIALMVRQKKSRNN